MTRYKHIPLTLDELKEKLATWDEEELQNIYIRRELYSEPILYARVIDLVCLFDNPQIYNTRRMIEILTEEEYDG